MERSALVYRLGNPDFDARVTRLVDEMRPVRTGRFAPQPRSTIRARSCTSSGSGAHPRGARAPAARVRDHRDAHVEAMRTARPGLYEYEVQADLEFVFRKGGSPRYAYPSIVASGANACILHYIKNTERMEDGDLLLIDAGGECGYHTADMTRTFPVSGTFTAPQRESTTWCCARSSRGSPPRGRAIPTRRCTTGRRGPDEGLLDLGLLTRGVDESIDVQAFRQFYMHGTGHWLGMDVHDVGAYRLDRQSRPLEPGMVLTVEPGLYFDPERETVTFHLREYSEEEMWERRYRLGMAAAKKIEEEEKARAETVVHPVPAEYRGIGVRIEDDVLVTLDGPDVLTVGTPKSVEEVERTCAEAPRLPRDRQTPAARTHAHARARRGERARE